MSVGSTLRVAFAVAVVAGSVAGCTVVARVSNSPVESPDDAGPSLPPSSCLDVLKAQPSASSGVYTLALGGASVSAYCDMTLGGGGWTAFFVGKLGSANAFAHFEDLAVDGGARDTCPSPASQCLRHLPNGVTTATSFAVRCGDAALGFSIADAGLDYFGRGIESTWLPLGNPQSLAADAYVAYGAKLWTGGFAGQNRGWIISADDDDPNSTDHTFASSYNSDEGGWDYCNGVDYNSAAAGAMPVVMLLYR